MANEPAAAPAAPKSDAATVPAVAPNVDTVAPAPVAATPAAVSPPAAGVTDSTPAPSLLAGADVGKREGATAEPAKTNGATPPDATTKPDPASAATPADGAPPPEGAKPDAAKPAEGAKPDAAAKPDGAPDAAAKDALVPEAPPAPPVYGDLKLPDGFKLEDAKLKDFDSLLGTFETTAKAEHGQVEALRQSLVDFYHTEVQRIGKDVAKHQVDVWNRMKEGWINELKSDPELGGNRTETVLGNAKYAFMNFLGLDAGQQAKLMEILDNAGVSSHPLMVRGLNNLYKRFGEPEPVPPNPIVPPNRGKEPGQRGWYSAIDGQNLPTG